MGKSFKILLILLLFNFKAFLVSDIQEISTSELYIKAKKYYCLASKYIRSGDFYKALENLRLADELYKNSYSDYLKFKAYLGLKKLSMALYYYNKLNGKMLSFDEKYAFLKAISANNEAKKQLLARLNKDKSEDFLSKWKKLVQRNFPKIIEREGLNIIVESNGYDLQLGKVYDVYEITGKVVSSKGIVLGYKYDFKGKVRIEQLQDYYYVGKILYEEEDIKVGDILRE